MLPYSSSQTPGQPVVARNNEPTEEPPKSHVAAIVASILGLIALAGGAFAVYYLFFRTPLPNVTLNVTTDPADQVLVGQPFTLSVAYINSSDQALRNATVSITIPEGVSVIGLDPAARVSQQAIGEVQAQGIGSKTFQLIATNGAQSVKHIAVAFRYELTDGQTAPFQSDSGYDLNVGTPAVTLNFNVPDSVFAGQSFNIGLTYQNNSPVTFQNAKLILDYPTIFQFAQATSTPNVSTVGNKEWDLQSLAPAGQGSITVTGSASGQQSFFTVGVHLQVDVNGQTYNLATQTSQIGISMAPLSMEISANNDPKYVASLGDTLNYTLTYKNGSRFALQNIIIQAVLNGQMFSFGTLQSDATFNSVNNTLTWNTANTPALASIVAGSSGSVRFSINLQNAWPISKASDKNFTLQVHANVQSLTVPAGITAAQTASTANLITKMGGQATLATLAYFTDPALGKVNKGPYPPRVNQPTDYTVHWQIRNYSTDISNIHISVGLQSGAHMVAVLKSTVGTSPVYNSATGQVTWDIPAIPATKGALGAPVEAIFQIQATPSVNQVGQDLPLLSETSLTASDDFASTTIRQTSIAKTSSLSDDTSINVSNRQVQP